MTRFITEDLTGLRLPPPDYWTYRTEGSQKALFYSVQATHRLQTNAPTSHFPTALCVYLARKDPKGTGVKYHPPHPSEPPILIRDHFKRYLLNPIPLQLSRSYLEQLSQAAEPHRPSLRKLNSSISAAPGSAELIPDLAYCLGPDTVIVEVKPKLGVLSRSALLDPDVAERLQKYYMPTYFLKNYLLPEGTEKLESLPEASRRYNPLDLVSGRNILQHLTTLHNEGCKTLKIFRSGSAFRQNSDPPSTSDKEFSAKLIEAASHVLSNSTGGKKSCLSCVKEAQSVDRIDNFGAAFLLKRLVKEVGKSRAYKMIESYMFTGDEHKVDEWDEEGFQAAAEKVCYESTEEARRLHSRERYTRALEEANRMELPFVARLLADFMQAAVAADCSIIISMCPETSCAIPAADLMSSDLDCGTVTIEGQEWLYVVHIIDVGSKSIDKIEQKWAATDFRRLSRIMAAGGLPEF